MIECVTGQRCPSCGSTRTKAPHVRVMADGERKRTRVCTTCVTRWITRERTIRVLPARPDLIREKRQTGEKKWEV